MSSFNLLSSPKGVKFLCEICGKPAHMQCPQCRVTYYCSKEHQSTDWSGIHAKICASLQALRMAPAFLGSEEERGAYEQAKLGTQQAVLEWSMTESTKYLLASNFELAVPGALQALRLSVELYGTHHVQVVPAYLLLARATTGLRKFKQAEEYLSLAKWNVLQNPRCSHSLKSQLYRNFGKLYASQGKVKEALEHLANDIYFSSLEVGPEHVDTAGGYFHCGLLFHESNRLESALAMFDKTADIWYKFLSRKPDADGAEGEKEDGEKEDGDEGEAAQGKNPADDLNLVELDEMSGVEATEMLQRIISIREQHLGVTHTATGEAHFILGLIFKNLGRTEKALERIQKALSVYEDTLGVDHHITSSVKEELDRLEAAYFAV